MSCPQIFGQITCNKFDINYKLVGSKLSLSLNTDLPNNTDLMISVSRVYWKSGNPAAYDWDYYSSESTVQKWKENHTIIINNSDWISKLKKRQRELISGGIGSAIAKVNDSINVDIVVPYQTKFGRGNSKLNGNKVAPDHTIDGEINIYYPLGVNHSKKNKLANYLDLKVGHKYLVSEKTPVMPSISPSNPIAAISKIKYLRAGGIFYVLSVKKKEEILWYHVDVLNNNENVIGRGWINSQALIGQSITIKQ